MASYSKTLTDDLGVADRHTWSEMIYSWDTYTGTWDSYGDIPIQRVWTAGRVFVETLTHTEAFSKIATMHRTLSDSISHVEALIRQPIKRFSEAISHTEAFSRISTAIRTLTETITHTDSIMHHLTKNFADAISHVETLIKSPVKRIAETLAMTESFTRLQMFIRTLTDSITVSEIDWTWDMMSATWDDYTENWDYYSKAFVLIKILKRTLTDSITHTDTIITRILHYIKFTYLKTREVAFWGKAIGMGAIGKVGGEKLFGRVSNDKLNGKLKSEKLFGKIIKG